MPSPRPGHIDKLDFPTSSSSPGHRTPLLHDRPSQATSLAGSFFDKVAEGIQDRDRKMMARQVKRYTGYAAAVLSCLSAGSITAYSLYAPLFQSHLRYTQFQVNIVSITAELAMYLPVPIFGYICDRHGPGKASLLSALLFGVGYLLAAFAYHSGPNGWPFGVMVLAFVPIGMGTSAMYFSALTTCAKNFGRGKNKGLALAIPVASFGLSGMWQSQVGSRLLFERQSDGSRGDVDVFRFFIFLAVLLFLVGILGSVALRIVNEEEMIDEAVDELERSGLLQHDEFFTRAAENHGYGTMAPQDLSDSTLSLIRSEAEQLKMRAEEEARKKTWLLNEETRRFLADHTMWWLAAGFFLVTGPGEAFINNLGTIIGTLYPPSMQEEMSSPPTTPATHVSIVAITSTIARLLTGTLSDLLAPTAPSHQYHRAPHSSSSSLSSFAAYDEPRRFAISRITFLILFSLLLFAGQVLLASGFIQNHGERFWAVSALIGAGYGAIFSLVPIVISVVWGVENFGTNWGIVAMMPAAGAAVWGLVYSTVYDAGREGNPETGDGVMCYGVRCYAPTFWAMAVSVWIACGLWIWAWRGPGGWLRRGVAV